MDLREKYTIETTKFKKPSDPEDCWERTLVNIFETQEDGSKKQIGSFERNYHTIYSTWEPFEQNGKYYALCAPDYTGTSVLSLPDCKIIASEPLSAFGFCPTGFYVPKLEDRNVDFDDDEKGFAGKFGFVCGCVWGDDQSWKIEYLDLSRIEQSEIIRKSKFDYVQLLGPASELQDAFEYIYISPEGDMEIELKCVKTYMFYADEE